jgi:hypothetical protein
VKRGSIRTSQNRFSKDDFCGGKPESLSISYRPRDNFGRKGSNPYGQCWVLERLNFQPIQNQSARVHTSPLCHVADSLADFVSPKMIAGKYEPRLYSRKMPLIVSCGRLLVVDLLHDDHHHPSLNPLTDVQLRCITGIGKPTIRLSMIPLIRFTELDLDLRVILSQ